MSLWKRSAASSDDPASLGDPELVTRLEALMANATDHIRRERALLLDGAGIPALRAKLQGRPVLVVSRTHYWQDDLASLRRWIRERDPVLIGVGSGAESLLDAGYKPDVVIGSLAEISDLALEEAKEVVVTAASTHGKGGAERFERAGVDPLWFIASGGSADLALLLAEVNGAPVTVVAGGPTGLHERLAGAPDQVASSFVTRLCANAHVVDAPAVGYLTSRAASTWPVLVLLVAGVVAVGAAIAATPVGQGWWGALAALTQDVVARLAA